MVLLLALLTGVVAQSPTEPGATALPFRCEAPPGDYQPYDLQAGDTLSARVRLVRTNPDRTWYPAAGLVFVLPQKKTYAGVQLYVDPNNRDKLTIAIKLPGDASSPRAFATVPIGANVPISAHLENGTLTVVAAGIEETARVKAPVIKSRMLMCSSGAFDFELGSGVQIAPNGEQQVDKPPERGN